jgi:hypothetical protein
MLKMNLITRKELYGDLYWELYDDLYREVDGGLYEEVYGELYRELYRGMRQPLEFQIRADFSHSKISRV